MITLNKPTDVVRRKVTLTGTQDQIRPPRDVVRGAFLHPDACEPSVQHLTLCVEISRAEARYAATQKRVR